MKSKKESNVAIQYTYLSATVYFRAESLFERPPEVSVDLQSGEFLGPLQYRTWRKMWSIFKPGISNTKHRPNSLML